jgi:glycosyltransferase involved in cell wall biosynthesis
MSPQGLGDAWIGNELRQVDRAGVPFVLHALRRPSKTPYFTSDWFRGLHERTRAIHPLPPVGFVVSLVAAPFLFRGRYFAGLLNALFGERESLRNRAVALWHFLVACHWARGLRGGGVAHVHSQWIHAAGTVAWYGARLLGVPFSFTGHAADLFRNRVALRDKVRDAEFIGCISEFHRDLYRKLGAREEQMFLVYCGIDVAHFTPRLRPRPVSGPVCVLSSGRLVEKKGFDVLIDACALLRERGRDMRCVIGGSGPLEADLRARVRERGLEDRVELTGRAIAQEDLPAFMAQGDVYCLPCVWASDDDVDGLPQMLVEAMACGLPAVSTRLVGIPDLVVHEETGLLVEPRRADQLADALERLIDDEPFARRLAAEGRRMVERRFDIETCLDPLIERYRLRIASRAA